MNEKNEKYLEIHFQNNPSAKFEDSRLLSYQIKKGTPIKRPPSREKGSPNARKRDFILR